MPTPPNKTAQEQEATRRGQFEVPPEPVGDGLPQEPHVDQHHAQVITEITEVGAKAPTPYQDTKRRDIVAKWKTNRTSRPEAEDAEEIRRFANNGLPPEMAEQPEPQVEGATEPPVETEPAPIPKHKIKVMGQEREVTTEELIAMAQKNEAADHYLNEAKEAKRRAEEEAREQSRAIEERLRQVDELLEKQRSGQRQGPADPDQGGQTGAPPGDQGSDQDRSSLVKDIVYGDPEEAERKLNTTIATTAQNVARQIVEGRDLQEEVTNNRAFITKFKADHPDIDSFVEDALTGQFHKMQRADLEKIAPQLGVKPEALPVNPLDVANWHLHARIRRLPVRSVEAMTNEAYDSYVAWDKSRRPTTETTTETPPKVPITVTVNRERRRAAIPQQPAISTVPREREAPIPPVERSRSAVVQRMALQRSQARQPAQRRVATQ